MPKIRRFSDEPNRRADTWNGSKWARPTTRLAIYLRDGLACAYCGSSVEEGTQLSLDHIKPVSKGGTNDPTNLVTCCLRCNSSRGTRSVPAFARAVAGYLNHGINPDDIVRHVRNCTRRALPRREARRLIASRGSLRKAINQ